MSDRLTAFRQAVLAILETADTPITARDIYDRLEAPPNLSTVYRSLEYLERRGRAQAVALFDGTRYYYPSRRHGHFLVCDGCRAVKPFESCAAAPLERELERSLDFHITDHVLVFHGRCPHCRP